MRPVKHLILLLAGLCLLFSSQAMAIKLIYKDNRGHYHYRCTDKTGGITIVVYRAEGIYIDGPEGQMFFPMKSAEIVRSPHYTKITEKYARIGCRERLPE